MSQNVKITLTDEQYNAILNDYFAPTEMRKRLSKDEVAAIAGKLNARVNIPIFLSEEREHVVLVKIVTKIDTFLYDNLPNEVYDIIRSLDEGINDDEAQTIIMRLSKVANDKIDIPYLPEAVEYFAISFLIGIIVNAMRQNWDLDKSIANADNINVPVTDDEAWIFDTGE